MRVLRALARLALAPLRGPKRCRHIWIEGLHHGQCELHLGGECNPLCLLPVCARCERRADDLLHDAGGS